MKLTAFTDYSLRVLMYLAADPGRRATIAEIAAAFDIKENHLTKVVHFLGKGGWLRNVRGKGGGLELARSPQQIVVGGVVRATEGAALPAECFGDDAERCCLHRICRLRAALARAVDAFYAVLDDCTLEDVTANRPALARVLFVEPPGRASAHPGMR
jgi:Rrf2 family nitric oxide-sensitive transcriptional repressor